jgi:hypothetical protein
VSEIAVIMHRLRFEIVVPVMDDDAKKMDE